MREIIPRKLRVFRAYGCKRWQGIGASSVDVVILDYFMPEMNGQEVAIEMRRLRRRQSSCYPGQWIFLSRP